jgi:hypothetical protein
MPLAKTHYVGIPSLAIIQGLAWFTGHQADITTQVTTIMTGVFTAVSWILSQIKAIQMLKNNSPIS